MKKIRTGDSDGPIAKCEPFKTYGALSGEWEAVPYEHGALPEPYLTQFRASFGGDHVYVVRSYDTPIAWCKEGEWTIPDVQYSSTTTNHQQAAYSGSGVTRPWNKLDYKDSERIRVPMSSPRLGWY